MSVNDWSFSLWKFFIKNNEETKGKLTHMIRKKIVTLEMN